MLEAGINDMASNYIPQYLWDVITCPCPIYVYIHVMENTTRRNADSLSIVTSGAD